MVSSPIVSNSGALASSVRWVATRIIAANSDAGTVAQPFVVAAD